MEAREAAIPLRDGRRLSYAEYGDPDGPPVLFLHGVPGSRLSWGVMAERSPRPALRVIAPDRPGYGRSDFFRGGRSIVDYPEDVVELADALGIGRFAVFGPSGGGPYVLACAWRIPERLSAVGVFASATPSVPEVSAEQAQMVRRLYSAAARFPWLVRGQMALNALMARWLPGLYLRLVQSEFGEVDREVYARLGLGEAIRLDRRESFRQLGRGVAYDLTIPGRWPIPLDEIEPKVQIWQGEADITVPPAAGRYLAQQLGDAELTMVPGAGHLWAFEHLGEMVDAVLEAGRELGEPRG